MDSVNVIKSSNSINGELIDNIDLLLVDLYKNVLITNYDIKNELLKNSDKISFIKKAITDFTSYDFSKLQTDIKQMTKDGGNEIFKTTMDNVTKDLKNNVDKIILDISNGNVDTVKDLYGKNEADFETSVLSVLKNKLKTLETKVNAKIFPLIVDSLELLKNNDLEKLEKNYTLLEEISTLESNNKNDKAINEKKELLIKQYFPEEKFSEEFFAKRKNNLEKDFYNNMKNINLISSIKELFGDFLNSENIRLISTGKGQTIIYKFIYKITADLLISNSLKMQTDSSYLFKNMNKKNKDFKSNMLNKINTIKSVGNLEKDYATALVLTEIEETLEVKDLAFTKKIKEVLYKNYSKALKNITSISSISKEGTEKIITDKIEENKTLIENKIKEYEEKFTKFNKLLDKKTEEILNIDDNLLKINKNINNIEEITIDNIDKLTNVINNYKELQKEKESKIIKLKEIINQSEEKIKSFNEKSEMNNNEMSFLIAEQQKESALIEKIYQEIRKEESSIEMISKFLNNKNIENIGDIINSKENYKKEINEINEEITKIKSISDITELKNITNELKTKVKTDIENIKNIPNNLKNQVVDTRKEITKSKDFKELGQNIKEIFDVTKERIGYKKSKDYLRVVSYTIKTYGYKDNLEEYFKELSEVAIKKLEIFRKLEEKIKSMQYLEKVLAKYPEEMLKNNSQERIKNQFINILNDIDMYKSELLNFLTEKNNKGINQNMFDIDNELKDFLTNEKSSIKEIQIMNIIKNGTSKSSPKLNEKCSEIIKETFKIEQNVKTKRIISIKEGNFGLFKNTNLKEFTENNLNFKDIPYFEYNFDYKKMKNLLNFSSNSFDEKEYDDKYSYMSEDNILRDNAFIKYMTLKDKDNVNKNIETLIKDKKKTIPTYEGNYKDFDIFKNINENNKININVLSYMEYDILNIIKNKVNDEKILKDDENYINSKNDKILTQEANNIKFINIYFYELTTKLIGRDNQRTKLLEEIKKQTKEKINEITLIEDKFLLKQYLNNIFNNSIDNLNNNNDPVNFVGNNFDISKTENFNKDFNPKNIEDIKDIINKERYINDEHKEKIIRYFTTYISDNNNFRNKNPEEIKTEIISKLNYYINKNLKQENQIFINNDNDNILNNIIDNNITSNDADNEVIKKIYLVEDIISSKIKELNIKKELGKTTKIYTKTENICIENNIKMLEILLNQMKKNFGYQFVKKEASNYYETVKYISNIDKKTPEELIIDLLENQKIEDKYNDFNDENTMLIDNLDVKKELKEILSIKKPKIKSFYSYFVKINDDVNKLYLSNKDKNISILLFNNSLKNNSIDTELFQKIENINNLANKKFPDYEVKDSITLEDAKKENIKKELILLSENTNNSNYKKLLEMLIKSIDYSEELYLNNLNKIKELSNLINQEIDYKLDQEKQTNLELN